MAFRRTRFAASSSPTHRDDSDREDSRADPIPRRPATSGCFRHRFCFTGRIIFSAFTRPGNALGDRRFAFPADRGVVFGRRFSSGGNFGDGGATDKDVVLIDTSGVSADKALEAVPVLSDQVVNPVVCEVAVVAAEPVLSVVAATAADSCLPLAAVQYLIGYAHVYTGLDWWASIALTALLIRSLQLPWLLNEQNSTITTTTRTTITTTNFAPGSVEATDVFFYVRKLFQSKDIGLRRMVYLKEPSHSAEIERYLKQAIVDKNPVVASAALTNPEIVKRWSNDVQEVVQSRAALVQFHALGLLHQKQMDCYMKTLGDSSVTETDKDVKEFWFCPLDVQLTNMETSLENYVLEAVPVLSEVAVTAPDSCFQVAAVQYLIGYFHVYTGLDW